MAIFAIINQLKQNSMPDQMWEYQPNRFVKASKVLQANIYSKDNVIRVAIDLDVESTKECVIYSIAMADMAAAKAYIAAIPMQ